jgi:hypothetical protein
MPAGIEIYLVNARHYKNVPGRKTDVCDSAWLQYLHAVGLLQGSFRPEQQICAFRMVLRQVARACGAQCAPRASARGAHGNSGSGGLSTTLTLAMRLEDPVRGMAGAAASERRHFRTFLAAAVSQHRCSDVSSPTRLAPQSKCSVVNKDLLTESPKDAETREPDISAISAPSAASGFDFALCPSQRLYASAVNISTPLTHHSDSDITESE